MVKKMYYMDENLYHYFIGREDQSVQENVMIRRIDQALLVNRMLVTEVDLSKVTNKRKQAYMRRYLEIVTTVSSIVLLKSTSRRRTSCGSSFAKKTRMFTRSCATG